ncbi:tRNA-specific 2-thiouridylase MnmA protein [Marine Group I thaumarchaeote SCGC AAA799-E16]|uniref:tRNA-specific 2-thiouridylase MnmA protein n=3 Tax=Marine Group I TaxID=905826 RepID=A0A087RME3_9ARCH|nr:tRNA-specific 2-thiouridylase MnmA protein [Marine Group I thaumarchaeote SCGC AAA799-E16]KFM14647.1 tRNA-specific 2-thiouridylase MnmA protein [Marine Group I thaumarchaeote SCGC AAA799-D11]KFM16235.1 putative tRNA sulfurtransferase protein [Marine Group I thaumarchaeote SCGC RSA3]
MTEEKEKKKVVALLSGGLDSQLAVRMMQEQGFDVSAVAIKTPFCDFDCGRGCGFEIRERADDLNVNLKTVYLGDEYIEMLKNPKHGIGAGFNPCIDCRAMMFDAAKKHMKEIGAEFIVSGEVLGQRPMSQHGPALRTIEKESDLVGKIVRPLSAALLPETIPEKEGLIKRENLGMIRGRTRRNQLDMAKKYGIENPPNAGGGCLLTEPQFGIKAKDLFRHVENPTINDIDLLKIGRHFRLDEETKLVVGRNKDENEMIKAIALPNDILLEAKDHVGPTSILRGKTAKNHTNFASSVTLRYSDAPKNQQEVVLVKKGEVSEEISAKSIEEEDYIKFRI